MIVKIKGRSGWSFFEADRIECATDRYCDANYRSLDCGGSFFGRKNEDSPNATVWVILLFKNDKLMHRIIAQLTVNIYLLNNEGKTIERIN